MTTYYKGIPTLFKLTISITKKDERINPETGEVIPGRKWSQQTFYYVDYKHFVDVVKYRIMKMQAKVNEEGSIDVQTYNCPRCGRKYVTHSSHIIRYSALDAPSLIDPVTGLFLCQRCKAQVVEDDNTEVVTATQSRSTKMNEQLKPIIEQLKKTEGMTIPEISIARLTAREEISTGEEEGSRSRPVSFLEKPQKVQVSFHSADDPMPSGVIMAGSREEPAAVVYLFFHLPNLKQSRNSYRKERTASLVGQSWFRNRNGGERTSSHGFGSSRQGDQGR